MNENKIPEMLTVKDTAKKFGLSEYLIRTKAKSGEIVAVRIGKKLLINSDKFSEYLNTNTETPISAKHTPKPKAERESKTVLGISPVRI